MKRIKNLSIVLTLIISGLIILSCESESISNQEELYTYEFESVELIGSKYKSKLSKKSSNEEFESLILSSKLKTNLKIPKNILETKDVALFEEFFNKNKHKIEGELTFYFNGIEDKTFNLNEESKSKTLSYKQDEYPRRNECSYEGVRQCTQYNIYEGMNTVEKLFCAYAGLGCIGQQAAKCTSRNCFGDIAPNDSLNN
jgi:hypothetical protein